MTLSWWPPPRDGETVPDYPPQDLTQFLVPGSIRLGGNVTTTPTPAELLRTAAARIRQRPFESFTQHRTAFAVADWLEVDALLVDEMDDEDVEKWAYWRGALAAARALLPDEETG